MTKAPKRGNFQLSVGDVRLNGTPVQISEIPMNIIYFDGAPSASFMNGIVGVTLVASGSVPSNEKTADIVSIVGYLKCGIPAAEALITALQSAIGIARPIRATGGHIN